MKSAFYSTVLLLVLTGSQAMACVGCREPSAKTIANEPQTVMAGLAFSWSVLFMLGFSMLIVFGMTGYIWHTCRRLAQERGE